MGIIKTEKFISLTDLLWGTDVESGINFESESSSVYEYGGYEYALSIPPDFEKLERLLGAIFGRKKDEPLLGVEPDQAQAMAVAVDQMLLTLSPREEVVVKLRYGLNRRGVYHTQKEVASNFNVTPARVSQIEKRVFRKLRHPARAQLVRHFLYEWQRRREAEGILAPAELTPVIETIRKLTPALIEHLKRREDDISKIHWRVFEHLIAEFFASWGFTDVRLVGRNGKTSADIYAAAVLNPAGIEQRFFIEVKRWKDKVGIDVINQVLGAFIGERERYGWHAAMIVTVVGFTDFEKWSREELRMKGVELREKDDLLRWLRNYKQSERGLWLPEPTAAL